MKKFLLTLCFCGFVLLLHAQYDLPMTIVILQSTKDYQAALKTAKTASEKLNKPLELRNYQPNKQAGLSLTTAGCDEAGYQFPCYVARGNGFDEESNHISIEYSTGYKGFSPGYYIVVAAVCEPKTAMAKNELAAAKKVFKDAYPKVTQVWRGCMH